MPKIAIALSAAFVQIVFGSSGILEAAERSGEERLPALLERLHQLEKEEQVTRVWRDGSGNITGIWLTPAVANDDNVKLLANLPQLRSVKISCPPMSNQLSPAGARSLKRNLRLEQLDLVQAAFDLTPELSEAITELQGLKTLSIKYSIILPGAIKPFIKLTHLRRLTIANSDSLGDRDVKTISAFRSLSELDLSFTHISDASLNDLKEMPNLTVLSVEHTSISNDALEASRLKGRLQVIRTSVPATQPWSPGPYEKESP